LGVYSEIFWHFGKSILYLNLKCTLEANMWYIVFTMMLCLYYWRLHCMHFAGFKFLLVEDQLRFLPQKWILAILWNVLSYMAMWVFCYSILKTKIFTCSFQCLNIFLYNVFLYISDLLQKKIQYAGHSHRSCTQ
jgi:hypothetical protein